MNHHQKGFTLIELIAVMILVGIMSVVLMSRMNGVNAAGVQAGRDSLIAALFFAQQTAMARAAADNKIDVSVSGNNIDVTEAGNSLVGYPLILSGGVTLRLIPAREPAFSFDKLGRTDPGSITISHSSGTSVTITVSASGYAHY
jgi:MSHA pilin protein MshC